MRFLSKILGAEEIGDGNGVVRLSEEAADLIRHVLLRCIQAVVCGGIQSLLRGVNVGVNAALRARFFVRRKLRGNLRRFHLRWFWFGFRCIGSAASSRRARRIAQRAGHLRRPVRQLRRSHIRGSGINIENGHLRRLNDASLDEFRFYRLLWTATESDHRENRNNQERGCRRKCVRQRLRNPSWQKSPGDSAREMERIVNFNAHG